MTENQFRLKSSNNCMDMNDREVLELCKEWFAEVAERCDKLTSGNVSHNGRAIHAFALSYAEFIELHLKSQSDMNTDLRKRFEEAAREAGGCSTCIAHKIGCEGRCSTYFVAHKGAEFGYKEAIKVAKEWLMEHISCDIQCNEDGEPLANSYIEGRKFAIEIADEFETYMNKLLEENK